MAKLKTWIRAARPRTVLLSFSGVVTGGCLAATQADFYPWAVVLSALTAMLLQVLSNLANDLGDFMKGTDNEQRKGPQREMQSGAISEKEMKYGIALMGLACLFFGGLLLLYTFLTLQNWTILIIFAVLGIAAILAALFYTLGRHPYGYHGLGDLFCFLFFGWVAVAGTYCLATHQFDFSILLPASAMGFLSNAVLNINNMRDYENDRASGKNSLVVKIGLKQAFTYHLTLIIGAFVFLTLFCVTMHLPFYCYSFWLLAPFFANDLVTIRKSEPEQLDPLLPKQVVKTFLLALLFGLGVCLVRRFTL